MIFFDIFLMATALSMDAFSVSISCGQKLNNLRVKKYLKVAFTFGLFQAVMPIVGYSSSLVIENQIRLYSSWFIFSIFLFPGLKTLYDTVKMKGRCMKSCNGDSFSCLLSLALATSFDAFLAGVALRAWDISLCYVAAIIGIITFTLSFFGCFIGSSSRIYFMEKAGIIAATILFLLATKSIVPVFL